MTTFEALVKAFTRELEELKSAPTRSPSEMALKTRSITIYPVVIGRITSNEYHTTPSKAGVVKIALDQPGFSSVSIKSDLGQRTCLQRLRSDDSGNEEFVAWIQDGSPSDASELGGSASNSKTIPLELEVISTCDFTLTQYQTESWYQ